MDEQPTDSAAPEQTIDGARNQMEASIPPQDTAPSKV